MKRRTQLSLGVVATAISLTSAAPAMADTYTCAMCGDFVAPSPEQCPNECQPGVSLESFWSFPRGTVFLNHDGFLWVVTGEWADVQLGSFVWMYREYAKGQFDFATGAELVARCAD